MKLVSVRWIVVTMSEVLTMSLVDLDTLVKVGLSVANFALGFFAVGDMIEIAKGNWNTK